MARVTVPVKEQAEKFQISPDYVRISMAAAIQLVLKAGRMFRGATCGCINLLQNYPEGCYANCSYCGLARERPGNPENLPATVPMVRTAPARSSAIILSSRWRMT